ncbi:Conserved_hypothetical protein [Hexamita inflata]|uniref:Transmembrane protein n=1 Tax=Hexamita inflata TaxID=28002 RepID=A0ABP1GIN5_9EUKA
MWTDPRYKDIKSYDERMTKRYEHTINSYGSMSIQDPELTSLEFLEHLNIKELDLSLCPNIVPKLKSESITQLSFRNCNVHNTEQLDLQNLEIIEFTQYKRQKYEFSITSALKYLKLKQFILFRYEGIDLRPLQQINQLTLLYLGSCGLSDISQLKYLLNLKEISIFDNYDIDITPLQYLTQLETIDLIEQLFQQVCGRRLIELRGLFYVINFVETKQCQACQYFHFANNQQNSRKRLQPFNRQITIFVFNIYQNILFVFQITLFIFINVCVPSYVILFTNMRFITLWTQMISFARTHISAITLFAADTLRTYFCIYMIVFICFYYWSFNWAYYWLVTTFNFSWCSFNFIFCQIYFHLINYAFNIIRYFNFFLFWMQQFHQRKPINQYYLHKINKHPCGPTSTSSWKLNIFCKLVYVINSFIIIIVVTNYFRLFSGNTTRTYKFLHLTGLFHKF